MVTFAHWPIRSAEWVGTFNAETGEYTSINTDNIEHTLDVVQKIVDRYVPYTDVRE